MTERRSKEAKSVLSLFFLEINIAGACCADFRMSQALVAKMVREVLFLRAEMFVG